MPQSILTNIIGQENYKKLSDLFDLKNDFYKDKNFDKEWIKSLSEQVYNSINIDGDFDRSSDIFEFIDSKNISKVLLNCKMPAELIESIENIESTFSDQVKELQQSGDIGKRDNKAYLLFDEFMMSIDRQLSKQKITLQRTIEPYGGDWFKCLISCDTQEALMINFLWHFGLIFTRNFDSSASEPYIDNSFTIDAGYIDRVNKNYIDSKTGEVVSGFHYKLKGDETPVDNFDYLNLKKEAYKAGVMGILAEYYLRDN